MTEVVDVPRRVPPLVLVAGLAAGYGNTTLIGIPLALAAFGAEGSVPLALIIAVQLPIMMAAIAFLMVRAERQDGLEVGQRRDPRLKEAAAGRLLNGQRLVPGRGAAHGAVTATAIPVPGCTSRPLGVMRYRPVCTPAFATRWFADGVTSTTLAVAPVVVYDDKDDLQDRWLRRVSRASLQPPRHYVPAAQEFGDAIRWGMGWGMMPEIEIGEDLLAGRLEALAPRAHVDVALYWQQWRRGSAALNDVAAAVRTAARVLR